MRTSIVSILAAVSVVSAQSSSTITPAPKVTNAATASYVATIPAMEGKPSGSISAVTGPDGVGVKFTVNFSNLPSYGAPFMYHLHAKPVAENGSCATTLAHLDPYMRGELTPCDASKPETCQTGDLSGKYGNFSTASYSKEYVDPYSSTDAGTPAYFGNLSFVLHLANKTRIGCANFKPVGSYPINNGTTPSSTGGVKPTASSTSTPPAFTGAAVKIVGGTGAMLAAVAALML